MSNGQKFISILGSFGFKKVAWDKCPQGFEKSNYPCYCNKELDIWAEVYLSDSWQYMWIAGKGIKSLNYFGGRHIDDPKELRKVLNERIKLKIA